MPVVVCDTSPIRALFHLGLLDLLDRLFTDVILPPAVVEELEQPRRRFQPLRIDQIPFLRLVSPNDQAAVAALLNELDVAEAQAIVVASEIGADRILIDESRGRAAVRARGLRPLGALGVLVRAKRLGWIDAVAPGMDQLQRELGFFVSDAVRNRILKQAREL